MSALARQQRPGAPNPGSVERRAVLALAVRISDVPAPGGAVGRLHFEQRVNGLYGVDDARVVGRAQTEARQRQRVGTDDVRSLPDVLIGRAAFDRDEAMPRRRRIGLLRRSDTHIMSFDPERA